MSEATIFRAAGWGSEVSEAVAWLLSIGFRAWTFETEPCWHRTRAEDGDVQFVGVKGLEDGGWLTVADEDNARFQFPDIIGHCDVLDELEQSMFPMSEKGEVDPETGYWHPDVSVSRFRARDATWV